MNVFQVGDRVRIVNILAADNQSLNGLTGTVTGLGRPFIDVKIDDDLITEEVKKEIVGNIVFLLPDEMETLEN